MSDFGDGFKTADRSHALNNVARASNLIADVDMRVASFDAAHHRLVLMEALCALSGNIMLAMDKLMANEKGEKHNAS